MEIWVRSRGPTNSLFGARKNGPIISSLVFEAKDEASHSIEGLGSTRPLQLASTKNAAGGVEQSIIVDKTSGKNVGIKLRYTASTGAAAQALALSLVGSVEFIMLEFIDVAESCMIPVENLVAACSKTGTKLAVCAQSAAVVPGIAFALDLGADALVLPAEGSELCSDEELEALWEAAAIAMSQRGERLPAAEPATADSATHSSAALASAMELSPAIVTDVCFGALQHFRVLNFNRN
jgi:hypothetical protein